MISQNQMILAYLRGNPGGVTQRDAYTLFGCTRLAARIADLRHEGHTILSVSETGKRRDGRSERHARYYLVPDEATA